MKRLIAGLAVLKDAAWLALRRLPTLAIQAGGLLLAWLVFCGLLNVPDSHAWEVALSVLGWPALALGVLWLQVVVFRRMRKAEPRAALLVAIPVLLVWVAVWAVAWWYLAKVADNFTMYASYLNSRLPAPGRAVLTYERISGLMEDAYLFVLWWLVPGVLLPVMVETTTNGLGGGSWKRIASVWRGWVWWVALIVVQWVARSGTRRFLVWHAYRSVRTELVSALGRVFAIFAVDVVVWYLLLALLAAYLLKCINAGSAKADAGSAKAAVDGTPVVSQPRTDAKP
jgi:hypothetical protein